MLRYLKLRFILAALVICGTVMSRDSYAQGNDASSAPRVVAVSSSDCGEYPKALLDDAVMAEGKSESFIIIARLGTGERSRQLIRQRLFAPSNYLMESRGLQKNRVITAEGERVRGLGHVEVYVGGKLRILFKMERNKNFVSDCRP